MRSHLNNSQKSIQQILDDELKAQGQLYQINQNIEVLQNQCIGKQWWDGNFIIGWSKFINQEKINQYISFPKIKSSHCRMYCLKFQEMHQLDHNQLHSKTDARKKFKHKSKKIKEEQAQKVEKSTKKVKKVKNLKFKRLNNIKIDLDN